MRPSFTRFVIAPLALMGFLLVGCENKLTKENYDRIQVGMTIYQVTDILGPGEKQEKGSATNFAQDMLGEISSATARQNGNQAKQGLKDLTGDQGTAPKVGQPKPARPPSGVPDAPVRDVFLWKSDRIEINITFMDEKVVSKNQIGLD